MRPVVHATSVRAIRLHHTDRHMPKQHNLLLIFPRFFQLVLNEVPLKHVGHIAQRDPEVNRISPHAVQRDGTQTRHHERAAKRFSSD